MADVFEMDSSADAYGVFTHSRDGEPATVGQGAGLTFSTPAIVERASAARVS